MRDALTAGRLLLYCHAAALAARPERGSASVLPPSTAELPIGTVAEIACSEHSLNLSSRRGARRSFSPLIRAAGEHAVRGLERL